MRFGTVPLLLVCVSAADVGAQWNERYIGFLHAGTFDTGGPLSAVETTSLGSLEIDVVIPIAEGSYWKLEYPIGLIPVAWVQNTARGDAWVPPSGDRWLVPTEDGRTTTRGIGLRPAGIRGVLGSGMVRLQADAAVGVLRFAAPTPASNTSRLNFTAELGLGVRMVVPGAHLAAGYRLHHLSNAGRGTVNPGIDSHMVYFGFWVHWENDSPAGSA